jgi:N-acetyl-alpha-D-muramate 1-phosphate uridylyltransferase
MLFAAGFGTRMGALTADRPKPLLAVNGQTLLDRALDIADAADIPRKVINLHYHGELIAAHLAGRKDIALSWERPQILETGGGLRAALPLLGPDPVFTMNPDALWVGPNPLSLLRAAWDGQKMDALLLLLPTHALQGQKTRADFHLGPEGRISRAGTIGQHVYLGAQILRTDGLARITEAAFSLNLLWDQMTAAGRAYGLTYPGDWCDVGTPQGLADAAQMLALRDV